MGAGSDAKAAEADKMGAGAGKDADAGKFEALRDQFGVDYDAVGEGKASLTAHVKDLDSPGSAKGTLAWLKGPPSKDGKINMLIVLRGASFGWTNAGGTQPHLDKMSHDLSATGYDVLLPECGGGIEMQAVMSWLQAQLDTETAPWNRLVVLACSAGGDSFVQWLKKAPLSYMRVDGLISMAAAGIDDLAHKDNTLTCFTPSADNVVLVRGEHETMGFVIPGYEKFVRAPPGSEVNIVKSHGEEKWNRAGHAPHASGNDLVREGARDCFTKALQRFAALP